MKKIIISKLFLYRYRFVIGYVLLGVAFLVLLFLLPLVAQKGLSAAEIESATSSFNLGKDGIMGGDLVDLPYRFLQKYSIVFFGLTPYAIKLPNVIVGVFLGLFLILLLNRWFKSNVSLLASCLVVLSTPFLFLAGSGTPLIMIVFWPTIMLWLGSKIQGAKRPKPLYSFAFAIALLLSVFTPYMIYFAVFCVFFVAFQPHLRFIVKNLPKLPFVITTLIVIAGFVLLGMSIYHHPETLMELLFAPGFEIGHFFGNIATGLSPLFSWHNSYESIFLSPLISLPVFAIALIGLFSTTKGFFASRNSIASLLLVFCVVITGFNPNAILFFILPISILIAHGLKYILEKWYGLFPENPYARISALVPLVVLFGIMIVPNLLQYIYGYHYNPNVVPEFDYKLMVIRENMNDGILVVEQDYDFYKILEESTEIRVMDALPEQRENVSLLYAPETMPEGYKLERIITSPMRDNSDIIYSYTYTEKGE